MIDLAKGNGWMIDTEVSYISAVWCPGCKRKMPTIKTVYARKHWWGKKKHLGAYWECSNCGFREGFDMENYTVLFTDPEEVDWSNKGRER